MIIWKNNNKNDDDDIINEIDDDDEENENLSQENIWFYMKEKLKMESDYLYFKLKKQSEIKLMHISSIWIKLMKNVNNEIEKYNKKCYLCLISIWNNESKINLKCCGLSLHLECFTNFIKSKMQNNQSLKQHKCLICQNKMKHKKIKLHIVGIL